MVPPDRFLRHGGLWLWAELPLRALRFSSRLGTALVDGSYLAAWHRIAALAPPVAFLAGVALGWSHWTFRTAFSESLLILLIAAFVGVMSAHLGLMFTLGLAMGDLFLTYASWKAGGYLRWGNWTSLQHLVRIWVPLLIQYGLLSMLTVNLPLITKGLLAQFRPPASWNRPTRFAMALGGHAFLTYVLVYFWVQTVPVLIRPVFTWRGSQPTVAAMTPLQLNGMWVLMVAVLASALRMCLQGMTASRPDLGARLDELQERLAVSASIAPLDQRLPSWLTALGGAVWSTLILAGLLQSWLDWLLLSGAILFVYGARSGWIPIRLGAWSALMQRIPVLLRLTAGMLLIRFLAGMLLPDMIRQQSFRPMLLITILAIFMIYFLTPPAPSSEGEGA